MNLCWIFLDEAGSDTSGDILPHLWAQLVVVRWSHIVSWILVNIGSVNGLFVIWRRQAFTWIYVDVASVWGPVTFAWWQLNRKFWRYQSLRFVWKIYIQIKYWILSGENELMCKSPWLLFIIGYEYEGVPFGIVLWHPMNDMYMSVWAMS